MNWKVLLGILRGNTQVVYGVGLVFVAMWLGFHIAADKRIRANYAECVEAHRVQIVKDRLEEQKDENIKSGQKAVDSGTLNAWTDELQHDKD